MQSITYRAFFTQGQERGMGRHRHRNVYDARARRYYCTICGSYKRRGSPRHRRGGAGAIVAPAIVAAIILAVFVWWGAPEGLLPGGAPQDAGTQPERDREPSVPPERAEDPVTGSSPTVARFEDLLSVNRPQAYPSEITINGRSHRAIDYSDVPIPPGDLPMSERLGAYALALANADRELNGLRPVEPSEIRSAQAHAEDMYYNDYFSHWNTDGVKPHAEYTEAGGRGLVMENIGMEYSPGDPFRTIRDIHWQMVNDDAHSDWGHRDNVLDPGHTHANFGIAYKHGDRLYFVQHFETRPVDWDRLEIEDGILHIEAPLPRGQSIDMVMLTRDPEPRQLSARALDSTAPYSYPYYEWGEDVMFYTKPGTRYQECSPGKMLYVGQCVPYGRYTIEAIQHDWVAISIDLKHLAGQDGIHTAMVWVNGVPAAGVTLEMLPGWKT